MILPKEVELGVVPQKRTMRRGTAGASHVFRELYAAVNIKNNLKFCYIFCSGRILHTNIIYIWNPYFDKFGQRGHFLRPYFQYYKIRFPFADAYCWSMCHTGLYKTFKGNSQNKVLALKYKVFLTPV
jgi:hypothetical protein